MIDLKVSTKSPGNLQSFFLKIGNFLEVITFRVVEEE